MKRVMKRVMFICSVTAALLLAGCDESKKPYEPKLDREHNTEMKSLPGEQGFSDYKAADKPTFAIGSQVIINSAHTKGMKDAKATVVGAFDTVAYSVSYISTAGNQQVTDYKWLVNEELVDENDVAFAVGDKVVTSAAHDPGMKNAEVTIETVRPTTVYVVDYVDTENSKKINNYRWLIEDELSKE